MQRIGLIQPTIQMVCGIELDHHRIIVAHSLSHLPIDLHQEPGAIVNPTAIFIRAAIGQGGKKLVDQVAVGTMQLHPVEPPSLGPAGGLSERGRNLLNLGRGQFSGLARVLFHLDR